jgi:hypothetical protein
MVFEAGNTFGIVGSGSENIQSGAVYVFYFSQSKSGKNFSIKVRCKNFNQGLLENAGYCEAVPASGYDKYPLFSIRL